MYSNKLVIDILEYIDTYIDCNITIDELSKRFCYDKFYLMKRFKKEIGVSIFTYINIVKIYNSLKILISNSILKTALLNGYNSIEYYSEMFKKYFGVSPSIYKKFNSHRDISPNDYLILKESLLKINLLLNYVNEYKAKKKPEELPVLKLSIFK